jgi:hypothetical protein
MADIKFLFDTINCPDYGNLEILRSIPFKIFSKLLDSQFDIKRSAELYKELIISIVKEKSFDFALLSEKDLDYIARHYADLYEVESLYLSLKELGAPHAEALLSVLKDSPKAKGLRRLKEPLSQIAEESMRLSEKIFDIFMINKKIPKIIMNLDSYFAEYSKELGLISAIEQSMKGLSIGNLLSEDLAKHIREMAQNYRDLLPKTIISDELAQAVKVRGKEFISLSDSIVNALKPISGFLDVSTEAYKSFQAISEDFASLYRPFELTNLALINSEEIVKRANNWFSNYPSFQLKVPKFKFPLEIKEFEETLIDVHLQEEEVLQFEANESILFSNKLTFDLERKIQGIVRKEIDKKEKKYSHLWRRMDILSSPPSFFDFITKLVHSLSVNYWEIFWKIKGKKFVTRPERLIKSHLGTSIDVSFSDIAFIGPEIKIGNRYIDLLINFMGIRYIIEIKIVGPGWGIGWAKKGLTQLDNYMDIYDRDESYLVILDGRKTDRGEKLENIYNMHHGKVYVISSKIYWH